MKSPNLYAAPKAASSGFGSLFAFVLFASALFCSLPVRVHAQVSVVALHSFSGADGANPAYLMQATDGNFYGLAGPAANGYGTIFKMTPSGSVAVLHVFSANSTDGERPDWLIQGSDGNFYGTTSGYSVGPNGGGTVFEMTPTGVLTTLHLFTGADGFDPTGLIQGNDGNFYGTTNSGGASNYGTVFRITQGGALTTLYSFAGTHPDGAYPINGLIQGSDGNFYGSTYGYYQMPQTVFKITPGGTLTTLHAFSGIDGYSRIYVIQGSDGYLYGTAQEGGDYFNTIQDPGAGTVFKFAQGFLNTLYSFTGISPDGAFPDARLIQASDGKYYGTTEAGGASGTGLVFSITPGGPLTKLYSFNSRSQSSPYTNTDGANPDSNLIQDSNGIFYGTTFAGGAYGYGTVFALSAAGWLVIPSAGIGGSISPSTPHSVVNGSSVTFTATPSANYAVNQWLLDGVAVQNGGATFTLSNVITSHTVMASFMPPPSAPTGLKATAGNTVVALSWTASAGATSYNVYRGTSAGNESGTPIATGIVGTSYTNSGLANGTTYFYKVAAVNAAGTSSLSSEVSAVPHVVPPAVPTGLTAAAGNGKVTLNWIASPGATSYNAYRGTTSGGQSATPIAMGIAGTTYVNTGLTNGTTYYYRIAAFNAVGNSPEGNQASATPVAPPPVPTSLTAVAGNAKVTLSWSASVGATSYNVYRGTTSGGQSATPVATGVVGTTYANTGLTNGFTYYFRIAAFNAGGNSPEGNQAAATPIAPPAAPANLTAIAANGKVTLSWTASSGATSYSLYRGTAAGGETLILAGIVGTAYANSGLVNGTTYYYTVAAFNAGGSSPKSTEASATPVAPPAVPTNLTAVAGTGSVTLNWTASTGAAYYNVYRGTVSGGESATPVATQIAGTTFTDTGLTHGTTYYYRIAAFNAGGNSAEGNQAFATP